MIRKLGLLAALLGVVGCATRGTGVSDATGAWINIEGVLYWCDAKAVGGPHCVKPRVEGGTRSDCQGLDPKKYNCNP